MKNVFFKGYFLFFLIVFSFFLEDIEVYNVISISCEICWGLIFDEY